MTKLGLEPIPAKYIHSNLFIAFLVFFRCHTYSSRGRGPMGLSVPQRGQVNSPTQSWQVTASPHAGFTQYRTGPPRERASAASNNAASSGSRRFSRPTLSNATQFTGPYRIVPQTLEAERPASRPDRSRSASTAHWKNLLSPQLPRWRQAALTAQVQA